MTKIGFLLWVNQTPKCISCTSWWSIQLLEITVTGEMKNNYSNNSPVKVWMKQNQHPHTAASSSLQQHPFHSSGEAEAGMGLTINSSLLKRSVPVPVSRWTLVTSAPPRSAPRETRPGSPPKLLMLCCTHFRAASWSQRPAFPLASAEPGVGNKIQLKRKWQIYKFGVNVTFFCSSCSQNLIKLIPEFKSLVPSKVIALHSDSISVLRLHRAALLCPNDRKITLELLSFIRSHHGRWIQAQVSIDLAIRFFFYISSSIVK